MRPILLIFVSGLLFSTTNLVAQDGLESARNALAESLPDLAATRAERYLDGSSKLSDEKRTAALLLIGEAHVRAQQPKAALTALARIRDNNSDNSSRNYWQGLASALQFETPTALAKLSQVGEESPYFEQALYNSIELQTNRNNTTQAFELLTKLRAHNAQFLPLKLALLEAQLFLTENKPSDARNALEKIKSEDRLNPNIQFLTGKIELAAGETKPALSAFSSALTKESTPQLKTLARLGKCDTFLTTEENKEALNILIQILEDEPDSVFLELLHGRFEKLLNSSLPRTDFAATLSTFTQPETLGEDGNYATPSKVLASYYLSRCVEEETAKNLLQQIVTLTPESSLLARAHLSLAQLALGRGEVEVARNALLEVRKSAPDSPLAFKAADLSARLATENNHTKEAITFLQEAARHPDEAFTEQALLNQAVLTLSSTPDAPLSALSAKLNSQDSKVALELERALAQARNQSPKAKEALLQFTLQNPESPGLAQARLALTEILLSESQPDFDLIESQFELLPTTLNRSLSLQSFHLSHRLGIISNDWEKSVARGERHLKSYPEAEENPYFLLRYAESCFRNEDLNRARFLFAKTANLPNASPLKELALYFGARANLKIPTPGATSEALETLDHLINRAGPFAAQSRLLKARTLLDSQENPAECIQALKGMPGKPGDHPEADLLAAKAYRKLSTNKPESAKKAIAIYQSLLNDERTSYPLSNRIHYELALTYRENGQDNLAIDPLLQVVDQENKKPTESEGEWDYYYRCGFEAIDILINADLPRAALVQARKLAKTKGPGAEQARIRAEQIELEALIFTD